ncbi:MAG TPA: hypothetical protein VF472_23945 [Burkholderiaceae bacterium]
MKNTLALLCKVPADGAQLLSHLKHLHGDCAPSDGDAAYFWLVAADQFEKRGIACAEASGNALKIIEGGLDLANQKGRGADDKFLAKRAKVLAELAGRLKSPRPLRERATTGKKPDMVVQTGEVYAFPTMDGRGRRPYMLPTDSPFQADGWSAMVVLDTGRMFDWLPWCALASLAVDSSAKPTLDEAISGRMIFHLQTRGAGRFIPKRKHAKELGLELLGRIELDPELVRPHLSKLPVSFAIECDWPISYAAYSRTYNGLPMGGELATLIKHL